MDETSSDEPERTFLGFTIMSCMAFRCIGRWRIILYNPFDRDCWSFNYSNDAEEWQIGVGPIVLIRGKTADYD